jgi:hypothetical protein
MPDYLRIGPVWIIQQHPARARDDDGAAIGH